MAGSAEVRRPEASPRAWGAGTSAQMQQVFFFEVLLVAGISMYWTVYLVLSMTILTELSSAALVVCGVMLALHLAVLRLLLCWRKEFQRACVLGAALVVDTACLALLHPQLQQLWLPWLGMTSGPCQADESSEACQPLGRFDYRYDGPLIYQCFLVYHVLLLLQGSCGVVSSAASVVMYFGLLGLGGASVHLFDLAVVILPAAIGLVAKRRSEELCRQLDGLAAELERSALERYAPEEGAGPELPEGPGRGGRQARKVAREVLQVLAAMSSALSLPMAANRSVRSSATVGTTEAGNGTANDAQEEVSAAVSSALSLPRAARHSEACCAIVGTAETGHGTGSGAREEAASSSNIHDTTLSFNISSSEQQQPARPHVFHEAAAQTSEGSAVSCVRRRAPATCEGSTQTWMSWNNDGFHCTRCAKPPLAPGPRAQVFRSGRRLVESSDSEDSLSEDGKAGGRTTLRFPGLQKTPAKSMQILLISCVLAWNVRMRPGACCSLHATLSELQRIVRRLKSLPCKGEPFNEAYQCLACGACSEIHVVQCTWCSSDRISQNMVARAASPLQL